MVFVELSSFRASRAYAPVCYLDFFRLAGAGTVEENEPLEATGPKACDLLAGRVKRKEVGLPESLML